MYTFRQYFKLSSETILLVSTMNLNDLDNEEYLIATLLCSCQLVHGSATNFDIAYL
jgi:hypothetical protein